MARWKVPDDLPREDKNEIYHWHRKKWPFHFKDRSSRVTFVADEIEKCLLWHGARSNKNGIRDFTRACKQWIIKSMEMRGYEPNTPPSSKPSPNGRNPFEESRPMVSIGKQLKLLEGGKK
jgi:hypothetical protein